jgi:hypothetical protein
MRAVTAHRDVEHIRQREEIYSSNVCVTRIAAELGIKLPSGCSMHVDVELIREIELHQAHSIVGDGPSPDARYGDGPLVSTGRQRVGVTIIGSDPAYIFKPQHAWPLPVVERSLDTF